jgi:dihydroorotate dehydrogenase (NAD+) catalytic subunit
LAIDLQRRKPVLANITGGLSGPAIKPVALRMVWQVARAVKLPIIGIGGIMNASDALEFILAGASAVQVGTASFINPSVAQEIAAGMEQWLVENNVASVSSLVGELEA